jgi:hypothetical protein
MANGVSGDGDRAISDSLSLYAHWMNRYAFPFLNECANEEALPLFEAISTHAWACYARSWHPHHIILKRNARVTTVQIASVNCVSASNTHTLFLRAQSIKQFQEIKRDMSAVSYRKSLTSLDY